jgi:hypothetical protein
MEVRPQDEYVSYEIGDKPHIEGFFIWGLWELGNIRKCALLNKINSLLLLLDPAGLFTTRTLFISK